MTPRLAFAALLLVATFVVFTFGTVPQLNFPYALNYGEGVLLDQVRRVSEDPGLYPSFDEAPFVIDNYPPVYPMLVAMLPDIDGAPFFMARLVSLMSTLVAAWMVALLVRRWADDVSALTAAAVFLSLPQINDFAEFARIDSLALALGLVGMYCTLRDDGAHWRWIGCAAFFFSIYTRHSSLALPIVTFLILLRTEGKKSLVWPCGLLAAGAAAYVGLHLWTGGRIYDHLIHFNVLDYSWMHHPIERTPAGTFEKWFGAFYPMGYLLVFVAFLALVPFRESGALRKPDAYGVLATLVVGFGFFAYVGFQSWTHSTWGVPPTHFGPGGKFIEGWNLYYNLASVHVCLLLAACYGIYSWCRNNEQPIGLVLLLGCGSAAMIGRAGSDTNYLFELCVALTLAAGVALARGPSRLRMLVTALLVVTIGWNLYLLEWSSGGEGARDSRPTRLREVGRSHGKVLEALKDVPGPILSDNPSFPALLGKPMVYQPFMYRQLQEAGAWDPQPLHDLIAKQHFDAIVVSAISALIDPLNPAAGERWVAAPNSYLRETLDRWIKRYYKPTGLDAAEVLSPITAFRRTVWVRKEQ